MAADVVRIEKVPEKPWPFVDWPFADPYDATALGPEPVSEQTTFIRVQLVDQNGDPVPQRGFHLVLPDKSETDGFFDAQGQLYLDGIAAGTGVLTLSDIDAKELAAPVILAGQAPAAATGPIQTDTSSDDDDEDASNATVHEVASGDTLSSIAEGASFVHFATIWSHPDNATLRASREMPHVLLAGDQVVVPARRIPKRSVPTGTTTTLVVYRESLHAKVHVVDLSGDDVSLDGTIVQIDGGEATSAVISGATVDVPLVARDARTITLGGTEARLENLSFGIFGSDEGGDGASADGADDDPDDDADERRSLALELFQDSVGRKPTGDDADGTLDDLRTKAGV
jgi:hypothetical protein